MSFDNPFVGLGIPARDICLWDVDQCVEYLKMITNYMDQDPQPFAKVELNNELIYSILRYEELQNLDWLEKSKGFLRRQKNTRKRTYWHNE